MNCKNCGHDLEEHLRNITDVHFNNIRWDECQHKITKGGVAYKCACKNYQKDGK